MNERSLAIAAWAGFILVVATAAHLTLAACDLGLHPLFGLSYCRAQAVSNPLAFESDPNAAAPLYANAHADSNPNRHSDADPDTHANPHARRATRHPAQHGRSERL